MIYLNLQQKSLIVITGYFQGSSRGRSGKVEENTDEQENMTAPLRWPDKAELVRTNSLSNVRKIREILRSATRLSKDIELMRSMVEALELTFQIEIDLLSVGAKAEKEQMYERR